MERAQAQAQEKGGADAREIKAAMAQAARLSARVSELVMLEQEARGEAAAFKEEARAVREEHLKDLEVMSNTGSDDVMASLAPSHALMFQVTTLACRSLRDGSTR